MESSTKQQKSENFLKINPFGKIPAIEIGPRVIFESGAIISYLLDHFQGHYLLPDRLQKEHYAEYLSWFFFACTNFDSRVIDTFRPYLYQKGRAAVLNAYQSLKPLLHILNQRLEHRTYMVAEQFTAVDIFIGSQLGLLLRAKVMDDFPRLRSYADILAKRPAAIQAEVFTAQPEFCDPQRCELKQ